MPPERWRRPQKTACC